MTAARHRSILGRASLPVLVALLAGCRPAPPPLPASRYLIGQPHALAGVWSYPREDFFGAETGIATVLPDREAGRRTANGEVFDPTRLLAPHRTLQLPAILTVRNLETGREIRVRVNDRGPAHPGRIIGLSRRAAELLGIAEPGAPQDGARPPGAAQVRIAVDGPPSRALALSLPGERPAALVITAAPRGTVEVEPLAPPPGARAADWPRQASGRLAAPPPAEGDPGLPPDPLPEAVAQHPTTPGRLLVEAGSFFCRDLAQRQAASLAGARAEPFGAGRQPQYRVRLGAFGTLAEADRAVAAVLAAGLPEVRLLVE